MQQSNHLNQLSLITLVLILSTAGISPSVAEAQSLQGSKASLDRQNDEAVNHDFTFLREPEQLRRFVSAELLVPVRGGRNYWLKAVSFPYARPEVLLFIERLSAQYMRACGEELVVTSLTRPMSHQPRNASSRSVHPTGMALDLRRSSNSTCRTWLEETLLSLEAQGVLEATRERGPPHYHIAIFPSLYSTYVSRITGRSKEFIAATSTARHTVRRRDTLWDISKRYDTTPAKIRDANALRSSVIHPGQVLDIPLHSNAN